MRDDPGSCRSLLRVMSMLRRWDEIPEFMRVAEVRPYWETLYKRRWQLILKRLFDLLVSSVLLLILFIPMLIIAAVIKLDSRGPVFYRQERVTTYGRVFRIHKFRTMVDHADEIGASVTTDHDRRVTRVGAFLRDFRLDEFPQLLDIVAGNMSFVGTRPEIPKYVKQYTNEMLATLLMPAGITSEASIRYKDEAKLLDDADDVDRVYVEEVLPAKMVWNLESIRHFRFLREIITMLRTALAVFTKNIERSENETPRVELHQ